jgi:hypothetical protein
MTLDRAHLLDVPATAAWALGITPPEAYVGRAFEEAFGTEEARVEVAAAVA